MNCDTLTNDRLLDWLDDHLEPDERTALETHLEECDACRRQLEIVKAIQEAARRARPTDTSVPPEREMAILHAIRREAGPEGTEEAEGEEPASPTVVPFRRLRPWLVRVAALLVVVIGVSIVINTYLGTHRGHQEVARTTGSRSEEKEDGAGGETPPENRDVTEEKEEPEEPVGETGEPEREELEAESTESEEEPTPEEEEEGEEEEQPEKETTAAEEDPTENPSGTSEEETGDAEEENEQEMTGESEEASEEESVEVAEEEPESEEDTPTTTVANVEEVEEEAVSGDLNADGRADIGDVMLLARQVMEGTPPAAGDMNGDGRTDAADLMLLHRRVLGG